MWPRVEKSSIYNCSYISISISISIGMKNWRTMQRKACEEEEMEGRKEGRKQNE
jgi:hypothetical protein